LTQQRSGWYCSVVEDQQQEVVKGMCEYLSTQQVAEKTGISPGTLRYWRHANLGPASFTLGGAPGRRGRVVYRREEVERWIAEQEATSRRGGGAA
jgi:hypothetical protein